MITNENFNETLLKTMVDLAKTMVNLTANVATLSDRIAALCDRPMGATQRPNLATQIDQMAGLPNLIDPEPEPDVVPPAKNVSMFPNLAEIYNLECSIFDNKKKGPLKAGQVRWKMTCEMNMTDKDFRKQGRDFKTNIELSDVDTFLPKLAKRNGISPEYRATLKEFTAVLSKHGSKYMIGMVQKRGGSSGTTYGEDQFVFLKHDGNYNFEFATLNINGVAYNVTEFHKHKHPKLSAPYASPCLFKAFSTPMKDLSE